MSKPSSHSAANGLPPGRQQSFHLPAASYDPTLPQMDRLSDTARSEAEADPPFRGREYHGGNDRRLPQVTMSTYRQPLVEDELSSDRGCGDNSAGHHHQHGSMSGMSGPSQVYSSSSRQSAPISRGSGHWADPYGPRGIPDFSNPMHARGSPMMPWHSGPPMPRSFVPSPYNLYQHYNPAGAYMGPPMIAYSSPPGIGLHSSMYPHLPPTLDLASAHAHSAYAKISQDQRSQFSASSIPNSSALQNRSDTTAGLNGRRQPASNKQHGTAGQSNFLQTIKNENYISESLYLDTSEEDFEDNRDYESLHADKKDFDLVDEDEQVSVKHESRPHGFMPSNQSSSNPNKASNFISPSVKVEDNDIADEVEDSQQSFKTAQPGPSQLFTPRHLDSSSNGLHRRTSSAPNRTMAFLNSIPTEYPPSRSPSPMSTCTLRDETPAGSPSPSPSYSPPQPESQTLRGPIPLVLWVPSPKGNTNNISDSSLGHKAAEGSDADTKRGASTPRANVGKHEPEMETIKGPQPRFRTGGCKRRMRAIIAENSESEDEDIPEMQPLRNPVPLELWEPDYESKARATARKRDFNVDTICEVTGVDRDKAMVLLRKCNDDVNDAIGRYFDPFTIKQSLFAESNMGHIRGDASAAEDQEWKRLVEFERHLVEMRDVPTSSLDRGQTFDHLQAASNNIDFFDKINSNVESKSKDGVDALGMLPFESEINKANKARELNHNERHQTFLAQAKVARNFVPSSDGEDGDDESISSSRKRGRTSVPSSIVDDSESDDESISSSSKRVKLSSGTDIEKTIVNLSSPFEPPTSAQRQPSRSRRAATQLPDFETESGESVVSDSSTNSRADRLEDFDTPFVQSFVSLSRSLASNISLEGFRQLPQLPEKPLSKILKTRYGERSPGFFATSRKASVSTRPSISSAEFRDGAQLQGMVTKAVEKWMAEKGQGIIEAAVEKVVSEKMAGVESEIASSVEAAVSSKVQCAVGGEMAACKTHAVDDEVMGGNYAANPHGADEDINDTEYRASEGDEYLNENECMEGGYDADEYYDDGEVFDDADSKVKKVTVIEDSQASEDSEEGSAILTPVDSEDDDDDDEL